MERVSAPCWTTLDWTFAEERYVRARAVCCCLDCERFHHLSNSQQVDKYKVTSPSPLGSIFMVRLEKQKYWVEDNWFCRYVKVEPPGGRAELTFPCYRWLIGDVKVEIREGTGRKGFFMYIYPDEM